VQVHVLALEGGLRFIEAGPFRTGAFAGVGIVYFNPGVNEAFAVGRNGDGGAAPVEEFDDTLRPQFTFGLDALYRIGGGFSLSSRVADRMQLCPDGPDAEIQYICEVDDRLLHHVEISVGLRFDL